MSAMMPLIVSLGPVMWPRTWVIRGAPSEASSVVSEFVLCCTQAAALGYRPPLRLSEYVLGHNDITVQQLVARLADLEAVVKVLVHQRYGQVTPVQRGSLTFRSVARIFNPVRQFTSMIFATFELIGSVERIAGWLNGRVCAPSM